MTNDARATASRVRFWSIAGITATAYLQTGLMCGEFWLTTANVWFLGLSAVYSIGCIFVQPRCEARVSARWNGAYFAVQLALGTAFLLLIPVKGPGVYFLLPLVAQAVFSLPLRPALGVSAAAFALSLVHIAVPDSWYTAVQYAPAYLAGFVFTAGFSHLVVREIAARERAVALGRQLAEANAQLQARAKEREELAVTQERNRLAREIHDGLGHFLTAIVFQAEAAGTLLTRAPERAAASMANARNLAQEALADVRRSVQTLRADADRVPLRKALEQVIARVGDLRVELSVNGDCRPLPSAVEHALVRTVQEALTNVRKHAPTKSAEVRLDFSTARRVCLQVRDPGPAPGEPVRAGFGLTGVRERIELLGGALTAGPAEDRAFVLQVEVPA